MSRWLVSHRLREHRHGQTSLCVWLASSILYVIPGRSLPLCTAPLCRLAGYSAWYAHSNDEGCADTFCITEHNLLRLVEASIYPQHYQHSRRCCQVFLKPFDVRSTAGCVRRCIFEVETCRCSRAWPGIHPRGEGREKFLQIPRIAHSLL